MKVINVDKTLYTTAPQGFNRSEKEMAVYALLDQLDMSYIRVDHEVTATIEDCHGVDKLLDIQLCKNLFLCNASKTNFYLLLMPGEKKFVTREVSAQIGSSRLSFAKPEYMERFLNITPGAVSIMGLMNDVDNNVQLLIDQVLVTETYLGCHPCVNTASLKISINDILTKFLPYVKHVPIYVTL